MRELHVVALSSDGRHLVLSSTKGSIRGSFLLEISPALRRALDGDPQDEQPDPEPPAESALSPKEIQARLRAGQLPERVARTAGVPVERVLRYYGPVLSERAQVIDAARTSVLRRARRGDSAAELGASVSANLAARRITEPDLTMWDAHRRDDGLWLVSLPLVVRGRDRVAQWLWDPARRAVSAVDTYAADLAYVDTPVPRRRSHTVGRPPA